MAESAFYLPQGDGRFLATAHTAGPWDPNAQHFGPPSALLVRALENLAGARETMLARVTVEILGPAPLAEFSVQAGVVRPGRSIELLTAELTAGQRPVARASAWRFIASDTESAATPSPGGLPAPEDCPPADWPESWDMGGYLDAMEWRIVSGSAAERGAAAVWVRQRVPLIEGEEPSPLQRLFTVADAASGVSGRLDPRDWTFINSELTVHLQRPPAGEWIGIDADTAIGGHGVGTARSTLHDPTGPVAFGAQALLVRPRR